MNGITEETRKKLAQRPSCQLKSVYDPCAGRITVSHPLRFAGKQIHEPWAEVLACAYHHSVCEWQDCGNYDERKHQMIALNQATEDELKRYSKAEDLAAKKHFLNERYNKQRVAISPTGGGATSLLPTQA